MSKVYVVQDPDGKEIIPAKEFGDMFIVLTGKETSSLALEKLQNGMRTMRQDDYILLIGSPLNIGLAMHVALTRTGGKLRVLVWQRQTYTYKVEHINEYHESTTAAEPTYSAADHGPGVDISESPSRPAASPRSRGGNTGKAARGQEEPAAETHD